MEHILLLAGGGSAPAVQLAGTSGAYNALLLNDLQELRVSPAFSREKRDTSIKRVLAETSFSSSIFEGPKSCTDLLHTRSGGGSPVRSGKFSYLMRCMSNILRTMSGFAVNVVENSEFPAGTRVSRAWTPSSRTGMCPSRLFRLPVDGTSGYLSGVLNLPGPGNTQRFLEAPSLI